MLFLFTNWLQCTSPKTTSVAIPISKIKVGKVCGKGVGEVHGPIASTIVEILSTKRNVAISGVYRILLIYYATAGHFCAILPIDNFGDFLTFHKCKKLQKCNKRAITKGAGMEFLHYLQ